MLYERWDYLLLEASFLSLFLPSLSSLSMGTLPLPIVSFSLRWLLFRLMFGFGKIKFAGASTKEFSYLKGFMVNQPLPNFLGWAIHDAPLFVHKLGLVAFFLSEIIVPFGFVFCSGSIRVWCALVTIVLQANIQLTGNFGFFNLLSGVLCIPCLDGGSNLTTDFAWTQVIEFPLTHAILGGVLLPLSCFYLIFNSWCTMSLSHWPALNLPRTRGGDFIRMLGPFHVLHAYGIFFANSSPGIRWVPVIEGCEEAIDESLLEGDLDPEDRQRFESLKWEPYEYFYFQCSPYTRPPFVAPFHYRFDQSIFYDSVGMVPDTLFASLSSGNPYDFLGGNRTNLERVVQCLLLDQQGSASSSASPDSTRSPSTSPSPIESLFKHNPFPSSTRPVKSLRISLYLFQPTSIKEMMQSASKEGGGRAKYWHVKYVGSQTHQRAFTKRSLLKLFGGGGGDGTAEEGQKHVSVAPAGSPPSQQQSPNLYRLREPSMWHPDHYLWQTETALWAGLTSTLEHHLARERGGGSHDQTASTSSSSSSLAADLSWIVSPSSDTECSPNTYAHFWAEFLPALRVLHRRILASTACARDLLALQQPAGSDSTSASSPASASLTKLFLSHWAATRSEGSSGDAMEPVLDWSVEVCALNRTLLARFSRGDLRGFTIMASRLAMLLQHRILHCTACEGSPLPLYSNPGVDESHTESEASEAAQLLELERQKALEEREGLHALGAVRLPAPSIEASFGLIPPLRGARGAAIAAAAAAASPSPSHSSASSQRQPPQQLHLPSFFHLHLFVHHALLSCESRIHAQRVVTRNVLHAGAGDGVMVLRDRQSLAHLVQRGGGRGVRVSIRERRHHACGHEIAAGGTHQTLESGAGSVVAAPVTMCIGGVREEVRGVLQRILDPRGGLCGVASARVNRRGRVEHVESPVGIDGLHERVQVAIVLLRVPPVEVVTREHHELAPSVGRGARLNRGGLGQHCLHISINLLRHVEPLERGVVHDGVIGASHLIVAESVRRAVAIEEHPGEDLVRGARGGTRAPDHLRGLLRKPLRLVLEVNAREEQRVEPKFVCEQRGLRGRVAKGVDLPPDRGEDAEFPRDESMTQRGLVDHVYVVSGRL